MTCCNECAYPGNPGVCVEGGTCPCHDTEDDPLARVERSLARIAARHDYGGGEGEALTREVMARLAYRRKSSGKTCDKCQEFKPLSAFGVSARERDGLNRACKQCRNSYERHRVNA